MTTKRTSRRRTLEIAAGAAAAVAVAKVAQAATPNVVGVWKLVGGTMTDPSGKKVGVPYGPRGMGLLSLTSDGRTMAVLVDGRAKLADGAMREYRPTAATTPSTARPSSPPSTPPPIPRGWAASRLAEVRFEGERMILVPPERDEGGVKIHRELSWERISNVPL